MYLIIPSIEFYSGKCRNCISGEEGTEDFYKRLFDSPAALCKLFRLENVKTIHVSDSDSFRNYNLNNFDKISKLTQSTSLPFQVFANFKTYDDCAKLLNSGIHRIVLPSHLCNEKDIVGKLIEDYTSSRIIFELRMSNENRVEFADSNPDMSISEYIDLLLSFKVSRLVYKSCADLDTIINNSRHLELLAANFTNWTFRYNARSYRELKQIDELTKYGMDSIIIGDSFYSQNFPCQKIWRIAESRLDANQDEFTCDF